jgi:hypothetical protein
MILAIPPRSRKTPRTVRLIVKRFVVMAGALSEPGRTRPRGPHEAAAMRFRARCRRGVLE